VGHEGGDCVLVSWRKKKGGEGRYRRFGRARLTRLWARYWRFVPRGSHFWEFLLPLWVTWMSHSRLRCDSVYQPELGIRKGVLLLRR
jgi:hypothetical protein